ncbi:MAG: maleylacetoacetate isomerase [Stenotrophobium sp.]
MLKLYSSWRSSSPYRVRIALALKGVPYEYRAVNLLRDGGEQLAPDYLALNPQGRVPFLVDGDFSIGQSLAIMDYLDARYPQPQLIPRDAQLRARMWAFCQAIVADTQPLQNLGVFLHLKQEFHATEEQRNLWARHWIERGLAALEQELGAAVRDSAYVFGMTPTLADCVLVPQVYNAERYACDSGRFPNLYALACRLRELPPFAAAHPDRQPDAQKPA